ncbi:hypothetical protein [Bacillus toyonensis]|uniref:hypothetical protein n=1 Tax=Bacillus toyonensis TaxID=155322 RepID=UPI000BF05611|nr:hypothetical protein [Bacillus toyonensis]PEL24286.1 hypothetical protein CN624_17975 [Bacillus toyonensis]
MTKRPEVGFKDMKNYEFGGLEVDQKLENGYLLYVPYGVHVDIFNAMEAGIQQLQNKITDCENAIKENGKEHAALSQMLQETINDVQKHIEVLQHITPLKHEI